MSRLESTLQDTMTAMTSSNTTTAQKRASGGGPNQRNGQRKKNCINKVRNNAAVSNALVETIENAQSLRRSHRSTKGVGGALEQLQQVSEAVGSTGGAKAYKKQQAYNIPDSTIENPMAPQPPKRRKPATTDRGTIQSKQGPSVSVPIPVQKPAYLVPPGTEPNLYEYPRHFGFRPANPNAHDTTPNASNLSSERRTPRRQLPVLNPHLSNNTVLPSKGRIKGNRQKIQTADSHDLSAQESSDFESGTDSASQQESAHSSDDEAHERLSAVAEDDEYNPDGTPHDFDNQHHINDTNRAFNDPNIDPLLESGFDQSPSEDERIALQALRTPKTKDTTKDTRAQRDDQYVNTQDDSYDVVANYQKRNRVPKAPHPATLQRDHDNYDQSNGDSESDGRSTHNHKRSRRYSGKAYTATSTNPKRLGFYPIQWKQVIESAKAKFRVWMVLECAFPIPTKEDHRAKVLQFLMDALTEHQDDGGRVENGYFPKHQASMIAYIFADRSTFRAELKSKARTVVDSRYPIVPAETMPSQVEYMATVVDNVKRLLMNGKFLRSETNDEQGRTNNLMHQAIAELCQSLFYGPLKLASQFPGTFEHEVPVGAVVLVATVIRCCLEAYKGGYWNDKHEFSAEKYSPVYDALWRLVDRLQGDEYHWNKLCAARKSWASNARLRLGKKCDQSFDMDIILD